MIAAFIIVGLFFVLTLLIAGAAYFFLMLGRDS